MNDERISEVEQELIKVREQIDKIAKTKNHSSPARYWQLWVQEKQLEREIAKLSNKPYAVPYDIGCVPEAGVSGAVAIQTEYRTTLLFNAMPPDIPWNDSDTNETYRERRFHSFGPEGLGRAVVSFQRCIKSTFGHPNDEAIEGHPLYHSGLEAYAIFEVLNSDWICEIDRQNRISFPNTSYADLRHFIFTFHDSSFECVAANLTVQFCRDGSVQKKLLEAALEE